MLEGLKEPHAADHKQVAKNVLKPLVSTVTGNIRTGIVRPRYTEQMHALGGPLKAIHILKTSSPCIKFWKASVLDFLLALWSMPFRALRLPQPQWTLTLLPPFTHAIKQHQSWASHHLLDYWLSYMPRLKRLHQNTNCNFEKAFIRSQRLAALLFCICSERLKLLTLRALHLSFSGGLKWGHWGTTSSSPGFDIILDTSGVGNRPKQLSQANKTKPNGTVTMWC